MGTFGYRELLQFIESGDFQGLKSFLDNRPIQVDDRDENGTSLLMVASARGLVPYVKELIARGADVQAVDLDNWTPLLNAAKGGHLEVIEILLDHGAEIEHKDMVGILF
jgi:ankyrin repeat-rich membrane spanning protein